MTGLFFDQALLPQGWARDVRIAVDAGRIVSIASGSPAQSGDERHRIGLPGICNLHSHAFQRGMAGLAEIRGIFCGQFLDLARTDVSLRRPHDRRRHRGRGGAGLCRNAGGGIYPRWRVSLHPPRCLRRALRQSGRTRRTDRRGRARRRDRPDAVCRCFTPMRVLAVARPIRRNGASSTISIGSRG